MADIVFGKKARIYFPTKYHGEMGLSKAKWEMICSQPERFYYKMNGEKVGTTLINPDAVRHHRFIESQFMYYKEFESYKISDSVESVVPCKFFAVVVDTKTKRVCTMYPVTKPKPGREYKGR